MIAIVFLARSTGGGSKPTQKGLSHKHIYDGCHAALKRLQVDYLDLFFCHRPDPTTPIEETVRGMHHLIQQGKVLYWGTSEWSAQQIMEAYSVARQFNLTPPTMEQPQYNMFHRERVESEYRRLYKEIGLGTTIWSPLASGLLTGKYTDGIPSGSRATLQGYEWLREKFESAEGKERINKTVDLREIAKKMNTSITKLAIAWCLKNADVSTVILGASKTEQLRENLEALDVVKNIDTNINEQIEAVLDNKPAPEPLY